MADVLLVPIHGNSQQVSQVSTNPIRRPGDYQPQDRSMIDGGFWKRASFTVPIETSEERVQLLAYQYQKKAVEFWQAREGLIVMRVYAPELDTMPLPVDKDRKRYVIYAWCRLPRPVEFKIDVPDSVVPEMEKSGFRLRE